MKRALTIGILATLTLLVVAPADAARYDGVFELGGVIVDEDYGDLSSVQETYNLYDGFTLTKIRVNGTLNPTNYFRLDARDLNQDNRQVDFNYRLAQKLRVTARYDEHRQVFDPERAVTSQRQDTRFTVRATPAKWAQVTAYYNNQNRDGNRLSFPDGTVSRLSDAYDYAINTGGIDVQMRKDRRGLGVSYDLSDYSNNLDTATDRSGQIVSARVFAPSYYILENKLTHLLRGAYGKHELSNGGLDYELLNFQYTGVLRPIKAFEFKYNFYANRIDNKSTVLKTDNFQHNFDAVLFYRYGQVSGGYGYETNDDDRSLTSYDVYRAGTIFRYGKIVRAKVYYSNRKKEDSEKRTLLQDYEADQIRADLEIEPVENLTIGGGLVDRMRSFDNIAVKAEGTTANAYGMWRYPGWGDIRGDYAYSLEEYTDLAGRFDAESHIVTGRVGLSRIPNIYLSAGVTYMDIGKDLNIEKSILTFEGRYTFMDTYYVSAKYNLYNYDDYILLDRYYTANVVWLNVGYMFSKDSNQ